MESMNQSQLAKYHTALGFDEDGMKYEAIADDLCRAVNQVQHISAGLGEKVSQLLLYHA